MGFCKDFVWGTATAAFQIEGAANEDGRGRSIWDDFCDQPGKIKDAYNAEVACDHYHRYKEDVQLMKELGTKAYRFSISWSRILPEGIGEVNQKGIDFYNALIDELIANDIEPYVTLFHWDYPSALMARGGWASPESPKWFEYYTEVVARNFGDRVKNYMTFNEPSATMCAGHIEGIHAPGLTLPNDVTIKMTHHMLVSHGLAVKALRREIPDCKVGYAPCSDVAIPYTNSEEDIAAAKERYFDMGEDETSWSTSVTWWSDPVVLGKYPDKLLKRVGKYLPDNYEEDMETICQPLDFYCQNIYKGFYYKKGENGPEQVPFPAGHLFNPLDWPYMPEAMYWGPKFLYERYQLPFIISENGQTCRDIVSMDGKVHDSDRIEYLHQYLLQLKKANDEGVDVRGYFIWTLMDNFEWQEGFTARVGLTYTDYQTLERIKKDSYFWYQDTIKSNGDLL